MDQQLSLRSRAEHAAVCFRVACSRPRCAVRHQWRDSLRDGCSGTPYLITGWCHERPHGPSSSVDGEPVGSTCHHGGHRHHGDHRTHHYLVGNRGLIYRGNLYCSGSTCSHGNDSHRCPSRQVGGSNCGEHHWLQHRAHHWSRYCRACHQNLGNPRCLLVTSSAVHHRLSCPSSTQGSAHHQCGSTQDPRRDF